MHPVSFIPSRRRNRRFPVNRGPSASFASSGYSVHFRPPGNVTELFPPTDGTVVSFVYVCTRTYAHGDTTRSMGNEVTPRSFRWEERPLCTSRIRNSFFCGMRMSAAAAFHALISCRVTIKEKTRPTRYLRFIRLYIKDVTDAKINFDLPSWLRHFR